MEKKKLAKPKVAGNEDIECFRLQTKFVDHFFPSFRTALNDGIGQMRWARKEGNLPLKVSIYWQALDSFTEARTKSLGASKSKATATSTYTIACDLERKAYEELAKAYRGMGPGDAMHFVRSIRLDSLEFPEYFSIKVPKEPNFRGDEKKFRKACLDFIERLAEHCDEKAGSDSLVITQSYAPRKA